MNSMNVIADVVRKTVEEADQPEEVANLIMNWYEQVLQGNESIHGTSAAARHTAFQHLELIFDKMWSPHDSDGKAEGEDE